MICLGLRLGWVGGRTKRKRTRREIQALCFGASLWVYVRRRLEGALWLGGHDASHADQMGRCSRRSPLFSDSCTTKARFEAACLCYLRYLYT